MLDQFLGQTISGKYKVESFIRLSGPARMYRARHIAMDRPVTISILDPALATDAAKVAEFETGVRALARVSHPNVLNVTDFGSYGLGTCYAVFDAVEGRTLREFIGSEGKLDLSTASSIARGIAAGLEACHEGGVVHDGLSPSKILVNESVEGEKVKIFDFAFSGSDSPAAGDARYLAPEQLVGGTWADTRSDIYSLGAVFFEMIAGEPPFSAESANASVEELPPPLSSFRTDLPSQLEPLILRTLAADPEMRPQTAGEFLAELEQVSGASGRAQITASGSNIWKTAFIVLTGIVLLASALIYATSSKKTDPATALQPDANGQPVQPLNPATGAQEESLVNMTPAEVMANSNSSVPPGSLPGGDGYNAWANGGTPPAGAPRIGPGGQVITVPGGGSQFMPPDCILQPSGIYLCPVPTNANATVKPTPTPKGTSANANVQASPTPAAGSSPKPSPTPAGAKPSASPEKTPKTKSTPTNAKPATATQPTGPD
jgi:serine/threonine-protein kinase